VGELWVVSWAIHAVDLSKRNIFKATANPIPKTIQLALPTSKRNTLFDHSTTSLNSQQPIFQEFTRENPKSNNLPAISPTKKESTMRRRIDNQAIG
jgi:hypothetical protein